MNNITKAIEELDKNSATFRAKPESSSITSPSRVTKENNERIFQKEDY